MLVSFLLLFSNLFPYSSWIGTVRVFLLGFRYEFFCGLMYLENVSWDFENCVISVGQKTIPLQISIKGSLLIVLVRTSQALFVFVIIGQPISEDVFKATHYKNLSVSPYITIRVYFIYFEAKIFRFRKVYEIFGR